MNARRTPTAEINSRIAASGTPAITAKPMPNALAYLPNGAPLYFSSTVSHSGVSHSRTKAISRTPAKLIALRSTMLPALGSSSGIATLTPMSPLSGSS